MGNHRRQPLQRQMGKINRQDDKVCRAALLQCGHNSRQGSGPFNPVMHAMGQPRSPILIRPDRQKNRTRARLFQESALPLPKQATVGQPEARLVTSHAARSPAGENNRVKGQPIRKIHSQPLIHAPEPSKNRPGPRTCTTAGRADSQSVKMYLAREYESASANQNLVSEKSREPGFLNSSASPTRDSQELRHSKSRVDSRR